jgi:hypothetical protein
MQPSKINCRIQSTDGEVLIIDMLDINKQSIGLNKQTNRDLSFEVNIHPGNPYNLSIQTSSPNPTNVQVEFQVHTDQPDRVSNVQLSSGMPSELHTQVEQVQPSTHISQTVQTSPVSAIQQPVQQSSQPRPSLIQRVLGYLKAYKWYILAAVIIGGISAYYWIGSRRSRYSPPNNLAILDNEYEYEHPRLHKSRSKSRVSKDHHEYKETPVYAPDDDDNDHNDHEDESDEESDEDDNEYNEYDKYDEYEHGKVDEHDDADHDDVEYEDETDSEVDEVDEVDDEASEVDDEADEDHEVEHAEHAEHVEDKEHAKDSKDDDNKVSKDIKSNKVIYEELKPDTSIRSFKPKEPIATSSAKQLRIPSLLRSVPAL